MDSTRTTRRLAGLSLTDAVEILGVIGSPRDMIGLGRGALHELHAAYLGREATAAALAAAEGEQAGTHGGPVWWSDCDCGGESPEGEPLPGCGPGCPRGSWQGPLIWAAQDEGDVPGIWGLTEAQMFAHVLPRWEARGVTPESQRAAGERDRARRASEAAHRAECAW